MLLHSIPVLLLVAVSLANPVTIVRSEPPADAVFIPCEQGTVDPICHLVKQPSQDIVTEITHPNGTVEVKKNFYTREQLKAIREANNVVSTEHRAHQKAEDNVARFIKGLTKRESAPPICRTETQRWYDQSQWGYWYQSWYQVGNCFYCNQCTESISTSFSVAQTWTYGLSATFNEVITVSFGFSWGQTFTLSDTRTCQWNNVESDCHSIWYQPLMSFHNGWANYQTHTHCGPGWGQGPQDSYYDHNWAGVNVNQGGDNGVNQGNLGCNSGCGGSDHRQCTNRNNGGVLWGYAN